MTERLLLSVHQNASLLTPRYAPQPCKTGSAHLCATEAVHIQGSARTRHRFGDEIETAVTSQHAETVANPGGGAQG